MPRFTDEELEIAKSVDLTLVASSLGYTIKKVGKYHTIQEMDSIRIYDRTNWFRWSRQSEKGANGGSQIDFLRIFAGMDVKEAVFWLLDFAGYRENKEYNHNIAIISDSVKKVESEQKKSFVIPIPASCNKYLYFYLYRERSISREVIDYFINKGLIYEAKDYHNIVFKGKDKDGNTRFASMRGVFDRNGKRFKCDVAGNDKNYGFNISNERNDELVVFESGIDLMSYMDIYSDYETNKLALGMLFDAPLSTFLKEYPHIKKIRLCLDNDKAGRDATESLMEKYKKLSYDVSDCPPPKQYKDYNEWLVAAQNFFRETPVIIERGNKVY